MEFSLPLVWITLRERFLLIVLKRYPVEAGRLSQGLQLCAGQEMSADVDFWRAIQTVSRMEIRKGWDHVLLRYLPSARRNINRTMGGMSLLTIPCHSPPLGTPRAPIYKALNCEHPEDERLSVGAAEVRQAVPPGPDDDDSKRSQSTSKSHRVPKSECTNCALYIISFCRSMV